MLFDLISDLHISSFKKSDFPNLIPTANTLAVLGDVCEVDQLKQVKSFFKYVDSLWDNVLYVLGNHEFYNGYLDNTVSRFKDQLQSISSVIVMDNDVVSIDGIRYICSTLWSDMDKNDPMTVMACRDLISDYHCIKTTDGRKINPSNTIDLFNANASFIKTMLEISESDDVNVVLTHHAPSYLSVSPKFKGNLCNGAFVSDLSDLILDNPSIKVWAHGHTHHTVDYMIGDCRVIANPCGYVNELYKKQDYRPIKVDI